MGIFTPETQADPTGPITNPPVIDLESATAKAGSPVEAVERGIAEWVASLRNSPLTRNTAAYNALQAQLPVLSKLIVKEIAK